MKPRSSISFWSYQTHNCCNGIKMRWFRTYPMPHTLSKVWLLTLYVITILFCTWTANFAQDMYQFLNRNKYICSMYKSIYLWYIDSIDALACIDESLLAQKDLHIHNTLPMTIFYIILSLKTDFEKLILTYVCSYKIVRSLIGTEIKCQGASLGNMFNSILFFERL